MHGDAVVICWICGKSVPPEQYKLDEYGFPAHDGCKNLPKAEGLRDDQSKD
jgi:hypothetical protein